MEPTIVCVGCTPDDLVTKFHQMLVKDREELQNHFEDLLQKEIEQELSKMNLTYAEASRMLGIDRRTIQTYMKALGLHNLNASTVRQIREKYSKKIKA